MAVRLINRHQQPLQIDLRGGGVLWLAAGQRSVALREEQLYDNCHLRDWERAGWVSRVPARMIEVLAGDTPVASAAPKKRPVAATPAQPEPHKVPILEIASKEPSKPVNPKKQ